MKAFILEAYMAWADHKVLGVFDNLPELIEEAKDVKNRKWDYIYYNEWETTKRLGGFFLVRNGVWSQESERDPTYA